MRLHHHPNSTFSRRVRIALLEKRIPFELVEVDFANRAHKAPAFLAMNPYGRLPVLEDDGFFLYESTAILEYLEAKHPAPPLVPKDPRERGRCAMHVKLCDLEIGVHGRTLVFPSRFIPKERWDVPAMDAARAAIARHLDILDGQLEGRAWLAGDAYSLAEVCYTQFVEFFPIIGVTPPPRVAEWGARLLERPSAVATKPSR